MNKAYCFDLDGTITKEELLPLIAKKNGLFDEISALTDATIRGIIPFESSFKLRCRLLSSVRVEEVRDAVCLAELYSEIVAFIKQNKEHCYIVIGNLNIWVSELIEKIGCSYYSSEAIHINGFLSEITSLIDKGETVKMLKKRYDTVISVGDGMGDVPMFENSDISIAFGATHLPIVSLIEVSDYVVYEEKALCHLLKTL